MTTEHFTAWLTTDRSCLVQSNCDLTVIEDVATSYTTDDAGTETPNWASPGDQQFYGITPVDARDGDVEDAINQAEQMLASNGWSNVDSTWTAVGNGYITTVERTI